MLEEKERCNSTACQIINMYEINSIMIMHAFDAVNRYNATTVCFSDDELTTGDRLYSKATVRDPLLTQS